MEPVRVAADVVAVKDRDADEAPAEAVADAQAAVVSLDAVPPLMRGSEATDLIPRVRLAPSATRSRT